MGVSLCVRSILGTLTNARDLRVVRCGQLLLMLDLEVQSIHP